MTWRRLFLHNLGWKLFSLLIAIIIWNTYYLTGGTFLDRYLEGEVKELQYPGFRPRIMKRQVDTRQFRIQPAQVDIAVSGSRSIVDDLQLKDILVYVDPDDYRDGDTNPVPVNVHVPSGVSVTKIDPSEVQLERIDRDATPGY